ncbi:MAG: DUF1080 domain-containing protein [Planctomycetia bacterium]|nr:DUF1080 domain-containing protein [Planctomycetia bacterium]
MVKYFFFLSFFVLFNGPIFVSASQEESASKKVVNSQEIQSEKNQKWHSLLNGKDLTGWETPDFGGSGKITVTKNGSVQMEMGAMITGMRYVKEFPKTNFEMEFEAQRTLGNDFFAAVTFPVGKEFCSFVTGGWGGTVFGLSSVNGWDASENSTSQFFESKNDTWYKIRVRVTEKRIRCWVDKQEIVDYPREDNSFSTRFEVQETEPLGISNYCCESEIRNIRYRILEKEEEEPAEKKENKGKSDK